jgi:hypothetical protein
VLFVGGIILNSATYTVSAGAVAPTPFPEPKPGKFDQAAIEKIDLDTYPLVPTITDHVLSIYKEGVRKGNNIHVFSKIGDCMTATPDFMAPYASNNYDLGNYTALDKIIKYYVGIPARGKSAKAPDNYDSFVNPGLAATSGFNAAGILDSIWSDPKVCKSNESPLSCEFRVSKPGIAVIMFGTNDIKSIKPDEFDLYLRRVVVQTINNGTIPILSTFPIQPGLEERSKLYNQITVQVATDYDVPLINLYLGLKPLPHQGVDPAVTTHMTKPDDGKTGSLTKDDLQAGYNVRNLLTLQTLGAVLAKVDPSMADLASTPAATAAK